MGVSGGEPSVLGLEFQGERLGVGGPSAHMHVTFFSGFSRVGMKAAIEPYCCASSVHLIGEILSKPVQISL